jgi:MGT family glycosyltransferase
VKVATGVGGAARAVPRVVPRRRSVAFLVSEFVSHVYGTMGLARRLEAQGCSVEYWSGAAGRKLIRSQGFAHREVAPLWPCYERLLMSGFGGLVRDPQATLARARALRERHRNVDDALRRFDESLDARLAEQVPDLVVLDPLLLAYYPALLARGLECVALQDKPLPAADPLVPPPTTGVIPRDTPWGRARVELAWSVERARGAARRILNRCLDAAGAYTPDRLVEAVQRRAGPLASGVSATRRVQYDLHFPELTEWVLDAPEADLPRLHPLPDNVSYVGPCVDRERRQAAAPIEPGTNGERLVYVSMGTTVPHWTSDLALVRRVIRALASIDGVRLVVSAGNVRARSMLQKEFAGVHVFPFLPQLEVLKIADLAITHAGANAFRECIATGTPMLALPREFDQRGNGARVAFHGLGLCASRWFDSEATIRRKALRILEDDAFASRVRRMNDAVTRSEPQLLRRALEAIDARGLDLAAEACDSR